MRLSQLRADPARFQRRDTPWSAQTVSAIVREGVDLAKFDPLPVLPAGDGYVIAGDGHSRFEAIQRLRGESRLPAAWRTGEDFDVPCKVVSATEATRLAWTANLSRDNLRPCVFQEMLDSGLSVEEVARETHRQPYDVRKMLPLNGLADCIRRMVGLSQDAGGLDKETACVLAERFERHQIGKGQQQELYHKVLKQADLTPNFVRALLDRIGRQLAAKSSDGLLFEIPAAAGHVMALLRGRAEYARRAERGLSALLQCARDSTVLDEFPELKELLASRGAEILEQLKQQTVSEGALVGALCVAA